MDWLVIGNYYNNNVKKLGRDREMWRERVTNLGSKMVPYNLGN